LNSTTRRRRNSTRRNREGRSRQPTAARGRNAIGPPILTSGVLPGSQGLNGLPLELIATCAVVLVVSADVAARRQTGGGIARDELNNRRTLLRAMNL